MTNYIDVPNIKVTMQQKIKMCCVILDKCKNSNMAVLGLPLHLHSISDILDGHVINFDSNDFNENVRIRSFDKFINSSLEFLINTKMCFLQKRPVDVGTRVPMEYEYIQVSAFGELFLKFPFIMKAITVKILDSALFSIEAIKKYRWVFTLVSASTAILAWLKSHDIGAFLVILSISVGLVVAIFLAWLSKLFSFDQNNT